MSSRFTNSFVYRFSEINESVDFDKAVSTTGKIS